MTIEFLSFSFRIFVALHHDWNLVGVSFNFGIFYGFGYKNDSLRIIFRSYVKCHKREKWRGGEFSCKWWGLYFKRITYYYSAIRVVLWKITKACDKYSGDYRERNKSDQDFAHSGCANRSLHRAYGDNNEIVLRRLSTINIDQICLSLDYAIYYLTFSIMWQIQFIF